MTPTGPEQRGDGLGRRQFLVYGGGAVVAGWISSVLPASGRVTDVLFGTNAASRPVAPSVTALLRRREDFLRLSFDFYNLKLDTSGDSPKLVRISERQQAYVVVTFPAQSITEEALFEYDPKLQGGCVLAPCPPASSEPAKPPPLKARLGGGSRLGFLVPADVTAIPFTTESLLSWGAWTPNLVPAALRLGVPREPPPLAAPSPQQTAIELPWWVDVSPLPNSAWAHARGPVTHPGGPGDITELWHTRLGTPNRDGGVNERNDAARLVRAVWTHDPGFSDYLANPTGNPPLDSEDPPQPSGSGLPFRMSLSPRDRYDLVTSMADYQHKVTKADYVPQPAHVDRLMLTSLGGWLDASGAWAAGTATGQSGTSLQAWRHLATLGRDHYVKVVRKGYLCGWGHGASLIKVTERKFRTIGAGTRGDPKRRVAYLFQRYFLVPRQLRKDYGTELHDKEGRAFPFTSVRILTAITPNLDKPTDDFGLGATKAFVPDVGGEPFRFHMVGTDRLGRSIDFHAAAVFVDSDIAFTPAMDTIIDTFNNDDIAFPVTGLVRQTDLDGARVAVAESETPGDTDLEIQQIRWGIEPPKALPVDTFKAADQPLCFPTMAEASIRLAAAEAALGGPLGVAPIVELYPDYVKDGYGPGKVFASLKDVASPAALDFGGSGKGDRAGGVATPSMAITALSQLTGPVAGNPKTHAGGQFHPADFFGGLKATLLGDILLTDVIDDVLDIHGDLAKVPQLRTVELADRVETRLSWHPSLHDAGGLFIAEREPNGKAASLDLDVVITTPFDAGSATTYTVDGDLRNFQLSLLPDATFLTVRFNRLRFHTESAKGTDVSVDVHKVLFAGPVEFVNQLTPYLKSGGSGPFVELAPTKVVVGYTLALPKLTCGYMLMQNLALSAKVELPFDGTPVSVSFGVSSMENPFTITVNFLGGGGFFEVVVTSHGVKSFQVALEFGGALAIDVGVASGGVEAMAGVYLAIGVASSENPDGKAELTGYVRIKGEVEVLGIVSVTLTLKISLTYIDPGKAVGKATMIAEIEVAFVSKDVSIEVERRFGGDNDPGFELTISQQQWDTYCNAFEPIGTAA